MSERNYFFPAVLIATLVGLQACQESKQRAVPPATLSKEQMMGILWDMAQAHVFTDQFVRRDSTVDIWQEQARLQQQIFQIHRVTREAVYTSYQAYLQQPDAFREILDSISARSERDRLPAIQAEQTEKFEQIRRRDEDSL